MHVILLNNLKQTCHANNKHKFLRKFAANSDFNQTLFQLYVYENDIPIIETTEISEWRIKKTSDIIDVIELKFSMLLLKILNLKSYNRLITLS